MESRFDFFVNKADFCGFVVTSHFPVIRSFVPSGVIDPQNPLRLV